MEKEFIPYEESVKLKELEFSEPCFGLYAPPSKTVFLHHYGLLSAKEQILAPTYSQAFRWFREKYGLFIQPNRTIDSEGTWYYFSIASKRTDVCEGSFVYEEAELACLNKLIEIVESKSE